MTHLFGILTTDVVGDVAMREQEKLEEARRSLEDLRRQAARLIVEQREQALRWQLVTARKPRVAC